MCIRDRTSIELPYITVGKNGPLHMDIPLSRAKFNDLTYHLVQATREPVNQAINDSGVSIAQISKVLMVGGSSRIPAVPVSYTHLFRAAARFFASRLENAERIWYNTLYTVSKIQGIAAQFAQEIQKCGAAANGE